MGCKKLSEAVKETTTPVGIGRETVNSQKLHETIVGRAPLIYYQSKNVKRNEERIKRLKVLLFAPVAALGAVLLTDPSLVPPMFSSVFMDKMVGFIKSYFPVFMLGAVFGKVIELSGFSKSIVSAGIGVLGRERAILSIVVVCSILTYGGVSLFVVVFAVYPFAAEMFRQSDIPKRLIPCTIALGAFTYTMDSLP